MSSSDGKSPATGSVAPSPIGVRPDDAPSPEAIVASELDLYAYDVQSLHAQRSTLGEELRRSEHRLHIAVAEQTRLHARLEREHERVSALLTQRNQEHAIAVTLARESHPERSAIASGLISATIVGVVAVGVGFLAGNFIGGARSGVPATAIAIEEPTATATPPVILITTGAPGLPAPLADVPAAPTQPVPGQTAVALAPLAAAGTPSTPPDRCAVEVTVPQLAPGTAYILRIAPTRTDAATILWPVPRGRIAVSAVGSAARDARVPAIVPLGQLPATIMQASSVGELTTDIPAGDALVVLANDSDQPLPRSRAVLFYAGGSACA
ncbi:MAG: hypothetical protein EPO26_04340 [Chloroflexota bacterium]|nr:MAG: hypothetical protein EPO26_04340 [Chloroflexota bacterium]